VALARIGIGANVGDSIGNVRHAFDELGPLGTVVARSSLYQTAPWGVRDQPDFINAAALLETVLEPRALLVALKEIERKMGREPTERWGPRAIDLDILAYDDIEIHEPDLTIPHERLFERAFALAPLAEIDPSFRAALERLPAEARENIRRIRNGDLLMDPSERG
jgi:2-amino-4-hydroxy-6-hydroxymethyldihydropteridine diphosphokinase